MFERKVLVIENHPFLTFFYWHLLDVGEERDRNDDGSSVRQFYQHLTAIGGEIQIFDADGYIFHLTHGCVCDCRSHQAR